MDDLKLAAQAIEVRLPQDIGQVRLTLCEPTAIFAIAPFMGQGMAVNDLLKMTIKLNLPAVGAVAGHKSTRVQWFEQGKWLVIGAGALPDVLKTHAAVVDQSDAWAVLQITGAVQPVLSRLCPLDFSALSIGQTARSEVAHLPAILTPVRDGIEVMLPRSMASRGVEKILKAMESVAATAALAG